MPSMALVARCARARSRVSPLFGGKRKSDRSGCRRIGPDRQRMRIVIITRRMGLFNPLKFAVMKRWKGKWEERDSDRPERSFVHRGDLLAQFEDAVFPITLRVEPRKRGGKRGVVPAAREPRRVVNQTQRAQRLDQMQFARLEIAEILVAGEEIGKRARRL